MAEEGEFHDLSTYVELPFDAEKIADALGTKAERVYELRGRILPNTPQEVKDRLRRITLASENADSPSEAIADLDEKEKTVGIQIRTGIDRDNYVFEGRFNNIQKIEVKDSHALIFTREDGTVIHLTSGHVYISNLERS